jgi:hypothetical protein
MRRSLLRTMSPLNPDALPIVHYRYAGTVQFVASVVSMNRAAMARLRTKTTIPSILGANCNVRMVIIILLVQEL